MVRSWRALSLGLCCLVASAARGAAPRARAAGSPETAPPGFNVHLVRESSGNRFWRGGAPREDTLEALAATAKAHRTTATLFDLRTPPNHDDTSGKAGRLSPRAEAELAKRLGLRYQAVSALDRNLPSRLESALRQGDIYIHCMYGVNRTGFATARYACATGAAIDRKGLGKNDWKQGTAFQQRLRSR